jgi:hypothetical protein
MIMGVNVERGSRTLQGVSNLLPMDGRSTCLSLALAVVDDDSGHGRSPSGSKAPTSISSSWISVVGLNPNYRAGRVPYSMTALCSTDLSMVFFVHLCPHRSQNLTIKSISVC